MRSRAKLSTNLRPPKMELLDLPSEILVKICQFLPPTFVQYNLRYVNKLFWDLIEEHFNFVHHLKLTTNVFGPDYYCDPLDGPMEGNKEEDFPILDDDALVKLRTYLQTNRLDLLTMTLSINLNSIVDLDENGHWVTQDVVENFNSPARELVQIFPRLTNLTALELDCSIHANDKHGFKKAMGHLKHLQQLSLNRMTLTIWWALDALESLESLHVERFDDVHDIFLDKVDGKIIVEEEPRPFKVLTDFQMERFDSYGGQEHGQFDKFSSFWRHFPKLKNMQLGGMLSGVRKGAVPMITGLAEHCQHLETLQLQINANDAWDRDGDNALDDLPSVHHFSNLTKFRIDIETETLGAARKIRSKLRRYRRFRKCSTITEGRSGLPSQVVFNLTFASKDDPDPIKQVFYLDFDEDNLDIYPGLKSRKSLLDKILGPERHARSDYEITTSDEEDESRRKFQKTMRESRKRKSREKRSNSDSETDDEDGLQPGPTKKSRSVKS